MPLLRSIHGKFGVGKLIKNGKKGNEPTESKVVAWRVSQGRDVLAYSSGGQTKLLPVADLKTAYQHLLTTQRLTRVWFNTHLLAGTPCNFTTIGEIFVKMKYAIRLRRGEYSYAVHAHESSE